MFDSLRLCTGVIISVTLKQVDDSPYCYARSDGGHDGLKCCYAVSKKSHFFFGSGNFLCPKYCSFQSFSPDPSSFRFVEFVYATSGRHKKSLRHPFCDRMTAGYWLCQSRRGFRCSLLSRLCIGCPFLMDGLTHQVCPFGSV